MESILKVLSIYTLLALTIGFSSCQTDEVAPLLPAIQRGFPGEKVTVQAVASIPPDEVIRTDYTGATKWRITFENLNHEDEYKYQRYFSIQHGTFYTYDEINYSLIAAAMTDIDFVGRRIIKPYFDIYTNYKVYARDTQFKLTDISLAEFNNMVYHPEQFQEAFDNNPYGVEPFLPLLELNTPMWFENGDIFLFKTDQSKPRYGAIHVVNKGSYALDIPLIVEIIVEADHHGFELTNGQ